MAELRQDRHVELSEITDEAVNVYGLTREVAGVAKQIKAISKEETDPPNPVLEAIHQVFSIKQN